VLQIVRGTKVAKTQITFFYNRFDVSLVDYDILRGLLFYFNFRIFIDVLCASSALKILVFIS